MTTPISPDMSTPLLPAKPRSGIWRQLLKRRLAILVDIDIVVERGADLTGITAFLPRHRLYARPLRRDLAEPHVGEHSRPQATARIAKLNTHCKGPAVRAGGRQDADDPAAEAFAGKGGQFCTGRLAEPDLARSGFRDCSV